jgi:multidrug efflux pump subunit AcrB
VGLGQRYRRVIAWALDHRLATMGIATAAFVAAMSLFGLGLVGGRFMPNSDASRRS